MTYTHVELGYDDRVAVFAAFGLHHPDDALRAIDIARLEPCYFCSTQPAAISKPATLPNITDTFCDCPGIRFPDACI
jgi:hypothetical protein